MAKKLKAIPEPTLPPKPEPTIIAPETTESTESALEAELFQEPKGIHYKEKFTYGNTMSELLSLIGFSINRGGTGETELNTAWAYLLPELREELEEYRSTSTNNLHFELSSIPDGLVYFNEEIQKWEDVGNDNNKVLDVKALLNPSNRGNTQAIIFDNTTNKRIIRSSQVLKQELVQAYVLDMIPQIITVLQSHDLLMQTKKRTVTGGYVLKPVEQAKEA